MYKILQRRVIMMSQSNKPPQTLQEIVEDYKTTMKCLIEIGEKYADQALNLQLVFIQLKNQAKAIVSQLDEQLPAQDNGKATQLAEPQTQASKAPQ